MRGKGTAMRTHEFRELNETERFTLDYFLGCMDGQVSFALIGSQTILMLGEVTPEDSEETIREALEESTCETLSNPPDFETIVMEDGYGIVIVGRAALVTDVKLDDKNVKDGKMDIGLAVLLRNIALADCEDAEPIVAVFPD